MKARIAMVTVGILITLITLSCMLVEPQDSPYMIWLDNGTSYDCADVSLSKAICGVVIKNSVEIPSTFTILFSDSKELRTEMTNLVLLCCDCHNWIHSTENQGGQFLEGGG